MRDGILPALILCLALGLLLARAGRRDRLIALALLAASAGLVSLLAVPLEWRGAIVVGCWTGTLLCVVRTYFAGPLRRASACGAALAAGALAGGAASVLGRPDVVVTVAAALVAIPAGWLLGRGHAIVVKVLASWLLAVALLSAGVTLTAGAEAGADHLE